MLLFHICYNIVYTLHSIGSLHCTWHLPVRIISDRQCYNRQLNSISYEYKVENLKFKMFDITHLYIVNTIFDTILQC